MTDYFATTRSNSFARAGGHQLPLSTMHPVIPLRPSSVLVVGDVGGGKTCLLCHVAATLSRAGKRVLYIVGEGNPKEDIAPLIKAAGGDLQNVTMVDCVVEHADAELDGLLAHRGVAPHWPGSIASSPTPSRRSNPTASNAIRSVGA